MSLRNRRANRLCVTNVTGLLPACLLWCSINKTVFGSFIKRSFKSKVKFGGNCFQTELLSRLSHKVCRLFPPGSAVPLRKFSSDSPAKFETQRANSRNPVDQRLWSASRVVFWNSLNALIIYSSTLWGSFHPLGPNEPQKNWTIIISVNWESQITPWGCTISYSSNSPKTFFWMDSAQ